MRTLRLILGIPAIVLLFLPYTTDTSPWAAVCGWSDFWLGPWIVFLGLPFFLSVLVFVVEAQLFLKKSMSKTERIVCHIFAYTALACGLLPLTLVIWDNGFDEGMILLFLICGIPFLIAISLMFLTRRLGPDKAALVAMRAAWLPNAITCGILFWTEGWEIGAYLAAFTTALYSAEITLLMTGKEGLPERIGLNV